MKKRLLSLALVLVMCLGLVPAAGAERYRMSDADENGFIIEGGILKRYLGKNSDVIIPDGVTAIGTSAFSSWNDLVNVTIPNSVTSIGSEAFYRCPNLNKITIPGSVTTIGSEAFYGCSSLSEIIIPDSVTKLERSTFSGCSSLERAVIGNSVTEIGRSAFYGCSSLSEIIIPDSVTKLEISTFSGCSSLEQAVIGNGVTEIGEYAFQGCTNLKQVTFGQSVAYIGESAFHGCKGLSTLTLPDSVVYVDFKAFANCSSLTEITIPQTTVISDTGSVFSGCELLDIPLRTNLKNSKEGTIVGYSTCDEAESPIPGVKKWFVFFLLREDGTLDSISDTMDASRWEAIKDRTLERYYSGPADEYKGKTYAWLWDNVSNELILPEGVKTIRSFGGYVDLNKLERIVFPNSLQVIGDDNNNFINSEFIRCKNLKEVVFPAPENASPALRYQDIGRHFGHCPSLERVVNFPDKIINEGLAQNQRIEAAWEGIDPKTCLAPQSERIVTLSNQICTGHVTEYEKAKAIYDWVAQNIVYDWAYYLGKKSEVAIFPDEVLDSKLTICDGYSRLTQALLLAQNIPAVHISGIANDGSNGSQWESHAWNMAYVDGRWIYIDSTWGRPSSPDHDLGVEQSHQYSPNWFDPPLFFLSMSHLANTSSAPNYAETPYPPSSASAAPTRSTVLVNGEKVAFDAYTINQNNYFKLRDLAKVLSGTDKQFEVTWDGTNNTINMLSGKTYTTVGGELAQGDGTNKAASINTATIYLDGQPVYLLAYTINENNYFKLRDVGIAFDFDVTWDGVSNTIVIDTTRSYTPD